MRAVPDYTYLARDSSGKPVEGTITAPNSAIALGRVRALGYEVERVRAIERPTDLEITQAVGGRKARPGQLFAENFVYPVSSGVPLKDLAIFYRQFGTLVGAGIPLFQSLATLESQTRNTKLKEILRSSQRQVQAGGRLSEVFESYPWIFSELQIEMLRAAEHGGMIEQMLNRIADYLEQELALRRLISRLTIYPKLVLFSALFILGRSFFSDFTPALSKLIVGQMAKMDYSPMDYLNDTVIFLAILGLSIFGVVAFCRIFLFQSPGAREAYERFKMGIPGLGKVVRQFALAKFGRAFGAMYAGGLPLNTAVRVAGNASGSKYLGRATERAMAAVGRGGSVTDAFRATGAFPPIVLDMLHTGEQTGNVDAMMTKVSEYLEGEAEGKAHLYSHLFATAIYLMVAIFVAFAIIKFYGGYASGFGAGL